MATNSASLSSKRRTRHRDDCKDRISRLPDEVLSHILSFIPTKYAVLTSILSNRWQSIWTLVPNLDFDDGLLLINRCSANPSPEICFNKFVTRVLSLRTDTSCSIHTFRLKCRHSFHLSHFNHWISSAIANGVRELDLGYHSTSDNIVDLPSSLLRWEKLEVLKLRSNFCIQFPDSICLPRLRVLHLIWMKFDDGSAVEKLISSCPVLEELEIDRGGYDSLHHLVIYSHSLKRLKIVAHLVDGPSKVVVDAPNVEFVDLCHSLAGSYDMKSEFSHLVKAKIDVRLFLNNNYELSDQQYVPSHQQNLVELLTAISNVRVLAVSENILNCLDQQSLDNLSIFQNLKHLVVDNYNKSWLVLSTVLYCSPNLITFVLKMADKFVLSLIEWHPKLLPHKCSMSYLEKIELEGFVGGRSEMELVSYLLKNATVLKKMSIRYRFSNTVKDVSQIVKKLLMFPRGSTTCQIEFI